MTKSRQRQIRFIVTDFLTSSVGWFVFNVYRFFTLPHTLQANGFLQWLKYDQVLIGQILVPLGMVLLYAIAGAYNKPNLSFRSRVEEFVSVSLVVLVGMLGIFFAVLVDDEIPERLTAYELMLMLYVCLFIPTFVVRYIETARQSRLSSSGKVYKKLLIVVPSLTDSKSIIRFMRRNNSKSLQIVGVVDYSSKEVGITIGDLPVISPDDISHLLEEDAVDAFIIASAGNSSDSLAEIINALFPLGRSLYLSPELSGLLTMKSRVRAVDTEPLVDITKVNISPFTANIKRIADVLVSVLALIILIPVFLIVAIAVKISSPGPVFFRQERIGYHKKPFYINKFRTMRVDAEANGPALSSAEDPRVTSVGRFLRKYRIDEFPQFWNVLVGDMSLVGPRPERAVYLEEIIHRYPPYSLIHQVRPGITSWGLVRFGYASTIDQMMERVPYDMLYLENVSIAFDLKILMHTVSTVIGGRGV